LSPLNIGAVVGLLFIWSFTFHQLTLEHDRLIRDAQARTQVEARAFGEYSLGSVRRVSEFLLDLRASWLAGREVFEHVIRERQETVRDLTFQVSVIDENGMLLYSSIGPTTERVDLSQREHFRVHKDSGGRDVLFISDPVQGKVSKKWSIQFTRPILRAGQFAGVVVVSVSPEQFASFANTLAVGKDGAATIIRESGQVLARVPNPTAGIEKPPRRRQFNQPGALETGSYRVVSGTDGVERIIGYHHVPEIGLYFLVGESVASVLAPYDGYRRTALVEAAASTLLLALLYFTLRRRGAERKRHIEDLRLASMVYASSSEAMMVTSLDGHVIDVNPAFTVTTGYSAQEFKGQSSDAIRSECNERAVIDAMREGVSTKGTWSGEYLIRRKDGSEFPALLTIDTFADSTLGEPRRVALIHDMTEKKRAEEVIWRQANFDPLTELPNRHMFYNRRIMASRNPCAILVVTSSVGANAWRVYEAMGAGALDAVDTPTLGGGPDADANHPLLTKIDQIGRLLEKPVAPRPRVGTPGRDCVVPLVAIGASAGGPTALATVLGKLPAEFGAGIAVIQHVDKAFAAGMAEWLNGQTVLTVRVAAEGDRPRAGEVLLAATNDHMHVLPGGTFGYTPEPAGTPYRPSVDVFFHSVVEHWRGSAIGVLLTGMGRDGAIGLKAMRAKGYHTIAQDAATSAVYGMPKAAAALDAARVILPLGRIADELITLVRA
jgi:PAS domain S-box-containing protein